MVNETIQLMKAHASVRNFTPEKISEADIKIMINAGRAASTWKNFQSYSIINVKSDDMKSKIFDLQPQKAIQQASNFLVFVGDLNRAKTATALYTTDFFPQGPENLLISSVDASLAAQNTLLAAESMGYGGVFVGLIREQAVALSQILQLPDYTYPIFGLAIGVPARRNSVKPRLPYDTMVFDDVYHMQDAQVIRDYDKIQSDFAGERRLDSEWSERIAAQFGYSPQTATHENLRDKGLM